MKIKEVPSKLYIYAEKELTTSEIPEYADIITAELRNEIKELNLKIIGSTEFIYLSDEDSKVFKIVVAFPIKEKGIKKQKYSYMKTLPYHCAYMEYKGSVNNISKGWEKLKKEVYEAGHKRSNQSREIYLKWVDFTSNDNITELQLGLNFIKEN